MGQEKYNAVVTAEGISAMKQMCQKCGLVEYKDLVNTSLTLLEWAIKETEKGNMVLAANPDEGVYHILTLKALDHVRDNR